MAFTQEQIRKFFSRIIKDDAVNKEGLVNYLADQIMDRYNASDELMMVALDMTPELKYEVGDTVYVDMNSTYIGSYDIDLMIKHDLLLKEDHKYIKGVIIAVKEYRSNPYSVKIKSYNSLEEENYVTRDIAHHGIYHEKIIPAPGRLNVGDII
jgi:hypothetical protein